MLCKVLEKLGDGECSGPPLLYTVCYTFHSTPNIRLLLPALQRQERRVVRREHGIRKEQRFIGVVPWFLTGLGRLSRLLHLGIYVRGEGTSTRYTWLLVLPSSRYLCVATRSGVGGRSLSTQKDFTMDIQSDTFDIQPRVQSRVWTRQSWY